MRKRVQASVRYNPANRRKRILPLKVWVAAHRVCFTGKIVATSTLCSARWNTETKAVVGDVPL